MKLMIFIVVCLTVVRARPQHKSESHPPLLVSHYESVNTGESYQFAYETDDGQKRQESGVVINPGTDAETIAVQGFYIFKDEHGDEYTVTYTADENGYRPTIQKKSI